MLNRIFAPVFQNTHEIIDFSSFNARRVTFSGQNATVNARREIGNGHRDTCKSHRGTINGRRENDSVKNGTVGIRRATDNIRRETDNVRRTGDSVRRETGIGRREKSKRPVDAHGNINLAAQIQLRLATAAAEAGIAHWHILRA